MGVRPSRIRVLVRAFAVCCCVAATLGLTGASASGKKAPHDEKSRPGKAAGPGKQTPPGHAEAPQKHASDGPVKAGPKNKARGHGSGGAPAARASVAGATAAPPSTPPARTGGAVAPQPAVSRSKSHAPKKHTARARARRKSARRQAARHRATAPALPTPGRNAAAPATSRPTASKHAVKGRPTRPKHRAQPPSTVIRTFERVVHVVPTVLRAAVIVLGFLLLVAAVGWFLLARTNRYLARQRKALLGEIGVLQAALLPEVPDEIGGLRPSVAYRPADGPAAGGDFYDAFPLEGGRVGIVIGDISGHGRDALMRTSLFRHTLRAYLDAGLEPRAALQVAGRVLDREDDDLATVIIATYEPATQLLRYASAGHPPPVFVGSPDHVPVTSASSPPIGVGVPTGLRQTTVSIPDGSAICLFTDGLIEARREGRMIGRLGLVEMISALGGEMSADALLDRVAAEADRVSDDMAACLFRVEGRADVDVVRIEELEVSRDDVDSPATEAFLAACGVQAGNVDRLAPFARETVARFGRAVVRVTVSPEGVSSEVLPANVESLAAAGSRRGAA